MVTSMASFWSSHGPVKVESGAIQVVVTGALNLPFVGAEVQFDSFLNVPLYFVFGVAGGDAIEIVRAKFNYDCVPVCGHYKSTAITS